MFAKNQIITTTLVALSLSLGLSACSPATGGNTAAPASSASASAAPVDSASASPSASDSSTDIASSEVTAEAANERINDFMAAVKSDVSTATDSSGPNAAPDAPAMTNESFQTDYAYSLSFIDQTEFSEYKVGQIIGGFAAIYMKDPDATIVSEDAESMKMDGDTATIRGSAFTVTLDGEVKKGSSDNDGALTLTFVDGDWTITDFEDPIK